MIEEIAAASPIAKSREPFEKLTVPPDFWWTQARYGAL